MLPERVPVWRFVFGLAVIGAWSALCLYAARVGPAVAIAAGVLFTVPLCSLGEWLVHGVLYHGTVPGLRFIRVIHHNGHHFALFPPQHYVHAGPQEFMVFRRPYIPFRMSDNAVDNALTKWSQVGLHFVTGVPLILGPAWLVTRDLVFVSASLGALSLVSWLLAHIHGCIHTPRDRFIERQGWFQWLDRHHYIHHIDLGANINFGLPLCDFLFGTQKWELTPEEAAKNRPFAEAKRVVQERVA
jgi:hypothetical protein